MKFLLLTLFAVTLAGCATTTPTHSAVLAPRSTAIEPYPRQTFAGSGESFVLPVRGQTISGFGAQADFVKNKGVDIQAPMGSDVRAARSGRVVFKDEHFKSYGKTVIIDHGDSFETVYSYNSEILVNVGDTVQQNDVIARVGKSGKARTPSLHFEVRRNGEPQNPDNYLNR